MLSYYCISHFLDLPRVHIWIRYPTVIINYVTSTWSSYGQKLQKTKREDVRNNCVRLPFIYGKIKQFRFKFVKKLRSTCSYECPSVIDTGAFIAAGLTLELFSVRSIQRLNFLLIFKFPINAQQSVTNYESHCCKFPTRIKYCEKLWFVEVNLLAPGRFGHNIPCVLFKWMVTRLLPPKGSYGVRQQCFCYRG